jgi:hypothetical protein
MIQWTTARTPYRVSVFVPWLIEGIILELGCVHPDDVCEVLGIWLDNILTLNSVLLIILKPARGILVVLVVILFVRIRWLVVPEGIV